MVEGDRQAALLNGRLADPWLREETKRFVNPFEVDRNDMYEAPEQKSFRVKRNPLRPYQIYRMYQRSFM